MIRLNVSFSDYFIFNSHHLISSTFTPSASYTHHLNFGANNSDKIDINTYSKHFVTKLLKGMNLYQCTVLLIRLLIASQEIYFTNFKVKCVNIIAHFDIKLSNILPLIPKFDS